MDKVFWTSAQMVNYYKFVVVIYMYKRPWSKNMIFLIKLSSLCIELEYIFLWAAMIAYDCT